MGLITLVGMGGVGALIIEFVQGNDWRSVFHHGISWHMQLMYGLGYGIITALIALGLLSMSFMNQVKDHYAVLFNELDLSVGSILFISYCAGVGEEMLFRGALQHYLGIPITSVLFVAIHGYLNPKDWRISVYGVYMTLVIIGVGYMYERIGMISAMSAHFIIDVILLWVLMKEQEKPTSI